MRICTALAIFALMAAAYSQYYGYNCGSGAGRPGSLTWDAYVRCCYRHERCLEGSTANWLCNIRVWECMGQMKRQLGHREIPSVTVNGVMRENNLPSWTRDLAHIEPSTIAYYMAAPVGRK